MNLITSNDDYKLLSKRLAEIDYNGIFDQMSKPVSNMTDTNPGRDNSILKLYEIYPLLSSVAEAGKVFFVSRLLSGESFKHISLRTDDRPPKIFTSQNTEINETDRSILKLIILNPHVNDIVMICESEYIRRIESGEGFNGFGVSFSVHGKTLTSVEGES